MSKVAVHELSCEGLSELVNGVLMGLNMNYSQFGNLKVSQMVKKCHALIEFKGL
jgi:hypothetical protein